MPIPPKRSPEESKAPTITAKKTTRVQRSTLILVALLTGAVGYIAGTRSDVLVSYLSGVRTSSDTIDLSSVQETYRKLKGNFDGDLNTQSLIDGASRGLTAAAGDRYTVFMDQKETEAFESDLSGELSGIGAEIGIRSGSPAVVRILPDSPAEANGLRAGDAILSVNDEAVAELTTEQVASKIRGDAGTSVKLVVQRDNEAKEFTITRAKVNNPSVRWEVKDEIGVITLTRFDTDTNLLTRRAAKELKEQNVRAVILDVRDNGGGYLDAATNVAGIWLNNKVVVSEKRGDTVVGEEKTGNNALLQGVKTVVLVNGGSASASEIVAGALQDYGVATLVGEKTFGKGSVQNIIQLQNGRTLKVTVARWYTPKGKNINQQGIEPDRQVIMTAEDTDAGRDPQLDEALKVARE